VKVISAENAARTHFAELDRCEVFSMASSVKADLYQPKHKEHYNTKTQVLIITRDSVHTDLREVVNNNE